MTRKYTAEVNRFLQKRMTSLLLSQQYSRTQCAKIVAKEIKNRFKTRVVYTGLLWQWDQINNKAEPYNKIVWDFKSRSFKPSTSKNFKQKIDLKKSVEKTVDEVKQLSPTLSVLEGVKPKNIVIHTNKDGVSIHINMD